MRSTIVGSKESETSVLTYELICRQAESDGIAPLAASLHFHLAALYSALGDVCQRDAHVAAACALALEHGLYGIPAKHYFVFNDSIDAYLSRRSMKYSEQIRDLATRSVGNWKKVTEAVRGG